MIIKLYNKKYFLNLGTNMHKVVLSLVGCSGSIVGVLATGTLANPDTTKTIPYPEVMNLQKVPTFDAHGMVRSRHIASTRLRPKIARPQFAARAKQVKMSADLFTQTIGQTSLTKDRHDRLGNRTYVPNSTIVLGYTTSKWY